MRYPNVQWIHVHEQYGLLFTHAEKKNVNAELKTWIQTDTKYYLNSSDSLIVIMSINYIIVYS